MATSEHTPAPENQQEEWRPAVGLEGVYEVSDLGRVRRVGKMRGTRVGHILTCTKDRSGYSKVKLSRDDVDYTRKVHRLVAEAFLGPIPDGLVVNHKDSNPGNNRADNLEYITQKANMEHCVAAGRSSRGKGVRGAQLTEAKVRAIRCLRQQGETSAAIAAQFGIHIRTVGRIVNRRIWSNVE